MFRQLLGVNGIGPKGALGILSALRPEDLRLAVMTGDAKAISRAPGVGAKTAQRIILDLKDKYSIRNILKNKNTWLIVFGYGFLWMVLVGIISQFVPRMMSVGYTNAEAVKAVKSANVTEEMDSEAVLKASLKYLAFL